MKIYLIYNDVPESTSGPVFLPFTPENAPAIPEDTHYLLDALKNLDNEVYYFNPADNLSSLITVLTENKPDFIINLVEYFRGTQKKEMNVAALYELLNIPYSGASSVTLSNCNNKILTKYLLRNNKVSTPEFIAVYRPEDCLTRSLTFPLIAKPALDDGSGGIENSSVVTTQKALEDKVSFLLNDYRQPVLVEKFVNGREFNVAMIEIDGKPVCLPVSEIDFSTMPGHLYNIVSFQAKWDPTHEAFYKTVPVCPAKISDTLREELYREALIAWDVMNLRGYARVDFRVDENEKAFVLEVNPNPDISADAGFLRATNAAGLSLAETLNHIIQASL